MGGIALLFIALILIFGALIFFTLGFLKLALLLVMAGVIGWLADAIVPGELPFGWLGAIAAGLFGSWLGTMLLGALGPSIFGIYPIPAFLGALVLAAVANVVFKSASSSNY